MGRRSTECGYKMLCNFKTNLFEYIYIRAVLNFCPETKGGWPFFASSKLKHKLLFCYHFH